MKVTIYFIFGIIMTITSCKTTYKTCFEIGQGGGFTGKYTVYRICNNGSAYLSGSQADSVCIQFHRATTRKIFKAFHDLQKGEYQFSKPFNYNYFIRYEKEGKKVEIIWGDSRVPPPANVAAFYDYVWTMLKKD